ncbi:ribbon-helix-helix domain-containing protein [Shewanella sp. SM69]|nr:ribbon-helix-helix domain-containing protein [Shewanella sp. SM69]
MSVLSVRLSDEIEQKLLQLAQSTGRTKSWLASQAIQDYLDREALVVSKFASIICRYRQHVRLIGH